MLTNLVLKECAPFLTPSVSYIFNLSVTTGVFPAVWKQATVIPLYKNRGKAEDPSNYRPVSLLPALGKALDKIQSQRLLKHLVDQQLISPHQFGFIPGKSTTMQWDVCKSPGFPSNRVAAGQVDPSAVRITMVCSLFACSKLLFVCF